jgi:hypothetical protein
VLKQREAAEKKRLAVEARKRFVSRDAEEILSVTSKFMRQVLTKPLLFMPAALVKCNLPRLIVMYTLSTGHYCDAEGREPAAVWGDRVRAVMTEMCRRREQQPEEFLGSPLRTVFSVVVKYEEANGKMRAAMKKAARSKAKSNIAVRGREGDVPERTDRWVPAMLDVEKIKKGRERLRAAMQKASDMCDPDCLVVGALLARMTEVIEETELLLTDLRTLARVGQEEEGEMQRAKNARVAQLRQDVAKEVELAQALAASLQPDNASYEVSLTVAGQLFPFVVHRHTDVQAMAVAFAQQQGLADSRVQAVADELASEIERAYHESDASEWETDSETEARRHELAGLLRGAQRRCPADKPFDDGTFPPRDEPESSLHQNAAGSMDEEEGAVDAVAVLPTTQPTTRVRSGIRRRPR